MDDAVIFPQTPGSWMFWCEGCGCAHSIDGRWTFNGNRSRPTITPSILARGINRCHSYVTDGSIQYLADSDHALAGQTVRMTRPPWEDDDDG